MMAVRVRIYLSTYLPIYLSIYLTIYLSGYELTDRYDAEGVSDEHGDNGREGQDRGVQVH